MMLIVWAVIAIVVLVAELLIYMEHEWGLALGGYQFDGGKATQYRRWANT